MPDFRFVFTAQDYDRTVAFYRDALALPIVASWDDHGRGTIFAAVPGGHIEVFGHDGHGSPPRVSGAIVAWEVADVDTEIARLRANGVPILSEPTDQSWGHRNARIEDPDGLRITLYQVIGAG